MTARIAEDDKKEYANKECDGRNVMENLIFSLNATEIYTHVTVSKQRDILATKHPRRDFHI